MPSARDAAEALALSALGWIAEDPERIGAFLGQSGLDPDVLRARSHCGAASPRPPRARSRSLNRLYPKSLS